MSGLLRRIRRPGAAEETRTEATALPDPAHGSAPASPAPSEDGQRLPAGAAPEDVERRETTGRRSKLRRRARFLRRARELALRDLGGLVYEARRREQDRGKLVEEKVQRLVALDAELHELEAALGTPRGETVLREPGVGGTCARCGELHAQRRDASAPTAARTWPKRPRRKPSGARRPRRPPRRRRRREGRGRQGGRGAGGGGQGRGDKAAADKPEADEGRGGRRGRARQTEADRAGNGAIDKPGSGNGRIDSEAPTEVAEPATTPDRPA